MLTIIKIFHLRLLIKKSIINDQVKEDIKEYQGSKFSIRLSQKIFHGELNGQRKKKFLGKKHGDPSTIINDDNVSEKYDEQIPYIDKWIEQFKSTASGLEIEKL